MFLGPVNFASRSSMPSASSSAMLVCLIVELVGLELGGGAEAFLEHVTRPDGIPLRAFFFDLAGLDVLADELQVLRIDPIAVFAQADLAHFEDRLGLIDPRLGLEPAYKLSFQLIIECRRVKLADDLALRDAGALGKD